jgi:hypothetical protein
MRSLPGVFISLLLLGIPALHAQQNLSSTPPAGFDANNLPDLPNLEVVPPEAVIVPYTVVTGPVSASAEFSEEAGSFYDAMSQELAWQSSIFDFYNVIISSDMLPDIPNQELLPTEYQEARYIITGDVSRDQWDEDFNLYTLTAWIPGNGSASRSVQVSSACIDPREVLDFIPFLVWQLTSVFPVDTVSLPKGSGNAPLAAEDWAWKHKWLYLGLQAGISSRFYYRPDNDTRNTGTAFDAGFRAEFQFFSRYWPRNYFSLSLISGAALNLDSANYRAYDSSGGDMLMTPVTFSSTSLSFPLGIKVSYKPGGLSLGLYGSGYYDLPLQSPPVNDLPVGYTLGLEAGAPVGPGILSLDLHYSADLGETVFPGVSGLPGLSYIRSFVAVSLGYSFGLLPKPAPAALRASQ